ncbi:hypothetical protein F5888DRAFT_1810486 [Russula emetica]|nr:hypothetical protein F5888DRAFT_1810486 [Russula emetica]
MARPLHCLCSSPHEAALIINIRHAEINQMEREMCSYLEWQLNVDPTTLRDFQAWVQQDFADPGPYPPMVLPQPAPASFSHQSTGNNINSSTGSSSIASRVPLSKDTPVTPSPSI